MNETTIYERLVDYVSALTGGHGGGFSNGFSSGFEQVTTGRVYPVRPQENTAVPYAIYSISKAPMEGHLNGASGLTVYTVEVESIAFDHDDALAIAQAAQDGLHYWRDLNDGVQLGTLQQANEPALENGFQVHQEFKIIGQED